MRQGTKHIHRKSRLAMVLAILLAGILALSACTATPIPIGDTPTPEVDVPEEVTETELLTDFVESVTDTVEMAEAVPEELPGIAGAEGLLIRSNTLTNYDFVTEDGEISGNIDDFLVYVPTGTILFADVDYGGLLDIGDTNLVMPLRVFRWGGEGQLTLKFDDQELQNYPSVGENWPDLSDPAWVDTVNTFWGNLEMEPQFDFGAATPEDVMWLSEMGNYTFVDIGAGVGTIQDFLVALDESELEYVLFGFGTTAAAQDPYILPYEAVDVESLDTVNAQIALDTSIEMADLQTAPRYDRNLYPLTQVLTRDFSTEIDSFWEERGFDVQ